jgi:hypothetical protein
MYKRVDQYLISEALSCKSIKVASDFEIIRHEHRYIKRGFSSALVWIKNLYGVRQISTGRSIDSLGLRTAFNKLRETLYTGEFNTCSYSLTDRKFRPFIDNWKIKSRTKRLV